MERAATTSSATSPEDVRWAASLLAEAREALNLPFEPAAVHLDYGFHNVIVDRGPHGEWHLTGVIDWMTAETGHPECDLSRPLATDFQYRIRQRDAFMSGYRSVQPEAPGFRERFPAFMLWERGLIWEYWQRNKGFKEGLGMREWMEPFVRMLDG